MDADSKIIMRPDDLELVRKILQTHVPGREVLAFGSRVNGRARKYSDLDLAVVGDTPLPLATEAQLENHFVYSHLPFKVDVLDWSRLSESFRATILKCAVKIQSADNPDIATDSTE